jgi:hypothetical protein
LRSQLAVTLSKSELKKLFPKAPVASKSERAHTCSVLRPHATVFGQQLSASGSDGRRSFLQVDNQGNKAIANTTDFFARPHGTRNAHDQNRTVIGDGDSSR